jgi:hypothetical protein
MRTLEDELVPLIRLLQDPHKKSVQYCIDAFYHDLKKIKARTKWSDICEILSAGCGEEVSEAQLRHMVYRAKNKTQSAPTTNTTTLRTRQTETVTTTQSGVENGEESELKAYLDVCYNNATLAARAKENEITVEMIKAWRCPSQYRLSNKVTEYTMTKTNSEKE